MISEKTIGIANRARDYLKENVIYTSEEVEYGYTQKVIEIALEEAIEAVNRANLKDRTFTTYDESMMNFCRERVKKEIEGIIGEQK
jgi:hypothetical protein